MVDINKAILMAIRTGKATFGHKRTLDAVRGGRAALVIISDNCPRNVRDEITTSSKAAEIKVLEYPSSSLDLGVAAGKPFIVSTMAIIEQGDSEILKMVS